MAVPAGLSLILFCQHVVDAAGLYELLVELGMTADAVVHDYLCTGVLCHNGLVLSVGDEIGHMLHAIDGFETILHGKVLMGHMAVVASGAIRLVVDASMTGMAPRGIVGCHDMAVDACGGVVAQIGVGTEQIEEQASKSEEHTTKEEQSHFVSV